MKSYDVDIYVRMNNPIDTILADIEIVTININNTHFFTKKFKKQFLIALKLALKELGDL